MTMLPDLFSFAYVPNWYIQLDELAALALPEPWRFRDPAYSTKNPDNPILERYIHSIFKKQVIDYNTAKRREEPAADYLHVENEFVCFHTGLYTRHYKAIYPPFFFIPPSLYRLLLFLRRFLSILRLLSSTFLTFQIQAFGHQKTAQRRGFLMFIPTPRENTGFMRGHSHVFSLLPLILSLTSFP